MDLLVRDCLFKSFAAREELRILYLSEIAEIVVSFTLPLLYNKQCTGGLVLLIQVQDDFLIEFSSR